MHLVYSKGSCNSLHTTLHVRCSSGILSRRYTQIDIDHVPGRNLRVLSAEEAWETIKDCAQCDKQWKNPTSTIPDQTVANLKTQLVENEVVRVRMPKCMAWLDDKPIKDLNTIKDKVDNPSLQSTSQVLPSIEEVSLLGEELSLFDRPNEVEKGRILEAHHLEPILQQQLSQRMAPSHHDGRKSHLLEDKQILSVEVFDEVYFLFGRHLEELQVTWAHLEKKQTRLRTYTNIDQEFLYSGWRRRHKHRDAVTTKTKTTSNDSMTAYTQIDIDHASGGNLRVLSAEEAWETIKDCAQCDKQWKNQTSTIPDQTIANLKTQLVENEVVRVRIPKCMECSKGFPNFDGPEPQPLLNSPSLDMFDDDWGLEFKEVSPLGEELSLFDRPNEVEKGRILEAHHLEPILQ
ncbi:hypothetical protein Tco_0396926 [Tanacetum coccineum]